MKKDCVHCGREIDLEATRCPKCGKRQDKPSLSLFVVNALYVLMGAVVLFLLLSFFT